MNIWITSLLIAGGCLTILLIITLAIMTSYRYDMKAKRQNFLKRVETSIGKEEMKNSRLLVGILARDMEDNFNHFQSKMDLLRKYFKELYVVVCENDSKDQTRQLFLKRSDTFVINEGVNNLTEFHPKLYRTTGHEINDDRIKKMVYLRNDLHSSLQLVNSQLPEMKTYILLADPDIVGTFDIEGVIDTFKHFSEKPNIDAIGFNGRHPNTWFFDFYAYNDFDPKPSLYVGLMKVTTSFSGGVFYRYNDKFKSASYSFRRFESTKPECEHVSFNEHFNFYVNTNMTYIIEKH